MIEIALFTAKVLDRPVVACSDFWIELRFLDFARRIFQILGVVCREKFALEPLLHF